MKLAKGLKTSSRKKTVAKSLAELPDTVTQTTSPEARPTETTTGTARSSAKPVTIEAKIDVGFGNALYMRGEGLGLSWTQGVPLTKLKPSFASSTSGPMPAACSAAAPLRRSP